MYQKKKITQDNSKENCKSSTIQKKTCSRLGALSLSLIVMIGFIFPVFAETVNNISSPETLLTLAFLKSSKTKSFDADFDMKINAVSGNNSKEVAKTIDIFNNVAVYGNVKANFESEESFALSEYFSYRYLDEELITINLFVDESKMIVNIPTLLEHSIYASFNDLIKTNLATQNSDIKFSLNDYYPLLTKKDIPYYDLLSLEYGAFMIDKIKQSLKFGKNKNITTTGVNARTYDCDEVILTLTIEEYYTIYFEVLNKLLDDPRVENIVETKFNAAMQISKDNKLFEQLGIANEDIEIIQNGFSENYATFIASIKSEINLETIMETLKQSDSLNGDIQFVFYIDEDKNIRSISESMTLPMIDTSEETNLDMTLNVELNMVYNNYEDVKVGMPNLTKAYNLSKNTQAAVEAIMNDVNNHISTYFESRPKITNLINEFNNL